MKAVKSNTSRIWHLTSGVGDRENTKTLCNRAMSYPQIDRDGYHFDKMHTWPAMQNDPWILCPKCGTVTDFMAASQERWHEAEVQQQKQDAARSQARSKAQAKTEVLNDIWQQTLDALESVGWQIGEPQYRRYTATMQINGFTFKMEFVRPESSFGVNLATGEVSEMIR